jgi:hypothetical protein
MKNLTGYKINIYSKQWRVLIMENNIRTMEFIGLDEWDRPVYKCIETGILWKDITLGNDNPELYNSCGNCFDGEPDCPIKKELKVIFKNQYKENHNRFNYQMLSRLKSDCNYYLGYGNRCKKHLYYADEQQHINEMKKLYNDFPEDGKPEWLTYEEILNYEKAMVI